MATPAREPVGLTIWEAQFGDFANCAQVVVDQFLSSGEQKWGRMCGLTMLLPHGYEGQARSTLPPVWALPADVRPAQHAGVRASTPAQVFHMLRRQVVRPMRRPLIVMTPKSLLRHPLAVASSKSWQRGTFQNAIGEIDALDPKGVKRVVFCSARSTTTCSMPVARRSSRTWPWYGSSSSTLPGRGSARHPGRLQPCHRLRLVSGGAAEPGRLVQHPSSLRQRAAKPCPSALCRSPGLGLTGCRLHVRPRQTAKSLVEDALPWNNELWMGARVGTSLTWNKPAGQEVTRN